MPEITQALLDAWEHGTVDIRAIEARRAQSGAALMAGEPDARCSGMSLFKNVPRRLHSPCEEICRCNRLLSEVLDERIQLFKHLRVTRRHSAAIDDRLRFGHRLIDLAYASVESECVTRHVVFATHSTFFNNCQFESQQRRFICHRSQ